MLVVSRAKLVVLVACAVLAGCATSRSEIALKPPAQTAGATQASARPVVIRSVKDERVFEQAPSQPSIPSLGFEGATKATAEVKARAVGRKRNTYGKALGDILLKDGQTVEGVVRENLSAALVQAGYRVANDGSGGGTPLVIDVHIRQFWAWAQPGFWAIKLNTNIATDLDVSRAGEPTTISVHAEDSRQMATEGAWMEIIAKALNDYRAQVAAKAAAFQ